MGRDGIVFLLTLMQVAGGVVAGIAAEIGWARLNGRGMGAVGSFVAVAYAGVATWLTLRLAEGG